ncbi:hypothetical protein HMPREF0277_0962 [Corynebacterium accolens ATCC 49726]|nr:hypothetical protein HMPREF0277_0962 [Corynebacterium accolens ATCC 49726]
MGLSDNHQDAQRLRLKQVGAQEEMTKEKGCSCNHIIESPPLNAVATSWSANKKTVRCARCASDGSAGFSKRTNY